MSSDSATPSSPGPVLIVHPHEISRNCWTLLLRKLLPGRRWLAYADGHSAVRDLGGALPALVVTEMDAAGNGVEITRLRVLRLHFTCPILVLSTLESPSIGVEAVHAGADGYITSRHSIAELEEAIELLLSGRASVPKEVAVELCLGLAGDRADSSRPNLTTREEQVLLDLLAGQKLREIGARLNISTKTVSSHKQKALAKLQCRTLVECASLLNHHPQASVLTALAHTA